MPSLSMMSSSLMLAGTWAQSGEMQEVLRHHNVYRCMHGLPSLTWDSMIASNAQEWAKAGNYAHSPADQRVINGEQCGENLAWGFPSLSGRVASKDWYQEIQYTSPYGTASSMSDSTPSGKAIGHYTQQVWAGTSRLGCGKGQATVSDNAGDFWVCQYCKAGNFQGQFEQNVPAPIKGPQECGGTAADVPTNFPSSLLAARPSAPAPGPAPGQAAGSAGSAAGPATVAPPAAGGAPGAYASAAGPATVTPPAAGGAPGAYAYPTGGLGVGMGMGSLGHEVSGKVVSGSLSLADVDGAAFCKSEVALEAVEKGLASRVGVSAEYVRAWCRHADARRLQSGNTVALEYSIQVPAGTDPATVAASIENGRQALEDSINDQLRQQGAPFRISVNFAVAQVSDDTSESMPNNDGAVGSASSEAARNSFSGLFASPAAAWRIAPPGTLVSSVAVALLVAGGAMVVFRRQGQLGSAAASPQNPME